MGCFGAIVCFSCSRGCVHVHRQTLWLVLFCCWRGLWRVVRGTLFGRFSVGGSSCSIPLCGSVHVRSAIEEVFRFGQCVPLFSRMLGSCHLVAVVASLGLSRLHSTPLHSTPLHSTPLHSTPLHSTPSLLLPPLPLYTSTSTFTLPPSPDFPEAVLTLRADEEGALRTTPRMWETRDGGHGSWMRTGTPCHLVEGCEWEIMYYKYEELRP